MWLLTERAEAGVKVGIQLQLNQEPDDFRSAWKALPVGVGCLLVAEQEFTDYRSIMGDSLAGFLTADSNAELGNCSNRSTSDFAKCWIMMYKIDPETCAWRSNNWPLVANTINAARLNAIASARLSLSVFLQFHFQMRLMRIRQTE